MNLPEDKEYWNDTMGVKKVPDTVTTTTNPRVLTHQNIQEFLFANPHYNNFENLFKCYQQWVMLGKFKPMGSPDKRDNILSHLHAAVGISGEAGELLDAVKKVWVYNIPLEEKRNNIIEEMGDLLFYYTALMHIMGIGWMDIIEHNVVKLNKRYPSGYTDKAAQDRADKAPGE